jgi:hypothetical protein
MLMSLVLLIIFLFTRFDSQQGITTNPFPPAKTKKTTFSSKSSSTNTADNSILALSGPMYTHHEQPTNIKSIYAIKDPHEHSSPLEMKFTTYTTLWARYFVLNW